MLAAEAGCHPSDFLVEGLHLVELASSAAVNPLRRHFPQREHSLAIATMGVGVVVAATTKWMPWVTELFRDVRPSEALFLDILSKASKQVAHDSYRLNGPLLYSVVSSQDLRVHATSAEYVIELGDAALLRSLDPADWPNAISPRALTQGQNVAVAAIAIRNGAVVGVATATEDSDALQQIGIDVQREHRGRGLGRALTSQVAGEVLRRGRVPYYGAAADNIASLRTAQSAGFYPCWTSAFTTTASGVNR